MRVGRERAAHAVRAEHHLGVVVAGAALGCDQVVIGAAAEDVGAFDPARLKRDVDAAIDQQRALALDGQGGRIEFLDPDGAVAVVAGLFGRRVVADQVDLAVRIPEQRRIDAAEGQFDGLGPGPLRPGRRHDHIAAAIDAGGDHVEDALVVRDVGGVDAARRAQALEVRLRGAGDHVGDLGPGAQVARMEEWQAGEVRERRVDQVIVVLHAQHGRIGVVAGQDRIAVLGGGGRCRFLRAAFVAEAFEEGGFGRYAVDVGLAARSRAGRQSGQRCDPGQGAKRNHDDLERVVPAGRMEISEG